MMPDSSFPLQGAVRKGPREEDRGALPARLRPLGHRPAPEHVRERGDYQDYFSSLALPRLQHLCAPENLALEPFYVEV